MSKSVKPVKLEDVPLWREADALAEHMYSLLPQFPPEEEWNSKVKLRNAACDLMFWSSMALAPVSSVADASPTSREADWAWFGKYANTLKAVYRFAGRQKFIKLDPDIMVRLDKLCEAAAAGFEQARKRAEEYQKKETAKELKPWLEKYEIWKKLNESKA
jgi:hypothetical protein